MSGDDREAAGGATPLRFISERVEVRLAHAPDLTKKPGCPVEFTWRGQRFVIAERLQEWHDYTRRGRMAKNMRAEHLATAAIRGSWGVGRCCFRVRTTDGRFFDLYYDRAPRNAGDRQGAWYLRCEWPAARDGSEHSHRV
jgi:hypothetical protein